jgi:protoporphyrinogen oxidase
MSALSRRGFLKIVGAGSVVVYLNPLRFAEAKSGAVVDLSAISPIDHSVAFPAPRRFVADDPERAHGIFWNPARLDELEAKRKQTKAEQTNLAVIGGGIAGLTSAYLHRGHKPIVLEQAPRFGGNSKGQSWEGIEFSIGAAYVVDPLPDSEVGKLLTELKLTDLATLKEGEDPVALSGNIYKEFWSGETLPKDDKGREQFTKLSAYFKKLSSGEIPYPEIPATTQSQRDYINQLDKEGFREHLERIVSGGPLHPHIETAMEHYCWSSFGATFGEISAACGLNFYCAEFGALRIFPGGNSKIAERLLEALTASITVANLRANSLVFSTTVTPNGVEVGYLDANGEVRNIMAKAAVMACPKFIAAKLLRDIEPERLAAIKQLRYHSYLVANVLIKSPPPEMFYDLYMLADGTIHPENIRSETVRHGVTDVVLANFAAASKEHTVLTLYRALPYDGARAEIFAPSSYEQFRGDFEKQLKLDILPLLKLQPEKIADIRIARWGHPLPVAAKGLISSGVVDQLRKPFKDRVFFVEQDNWALPAFETSVCEAFSTRRDIDKLLK